MLYLTGVIFFFGGCFVFSQLEADYYLNNKISELNVVTVVTENKNYEAVIVRIISQGHILIEVDEEKHGRR